MGEIVKGGRGQGGEMVRVSAVGVGRKARGRGWWWVDVPKRAGMRS